MTATTPKTKRPFVVALSGGIAAGKTAVSDRFAALGVPIIDTDLIARILVAPGSPLLAKIVNLFGKDVVDENGSLRRRMLRDQIFASEEKRKQLEAVLHPAILREAKNRIFAANAPYCIVVIPLLVESGLADWVDRVLVIDVSEAVQLQRLMKRDHVNLEQAQASLAAQSSRSERRNIADDIIQNEHSLEALDKAIGRLHERYLKASQNSG